MKKTVISKSYSQASYILPTRTSPVVATKQVDAKYENWKRTNGFEKPLSNQEYFNIYGTWR